MRKKLKKVLFAVPTNTSGGAERVLTTLANEFVAQGYKVVFVNYDCDSMFYPLDHRIKLVKMNIGFGNAKGICKLIKVPFVEIRRYCAVKKCLKSERPDAVVAFLKTSEILFGVASIRLKIPFITSLRNDISVYSGSLKLFRKLAYPRIRAVVCQTMQVKKGLDSTINCNNVVIPNPLAPEAVSAKNYIGIARSKKVISVGRLHSQKNFMLFIDAVELLLLDHPEYRSYSFLIFGEGPMRKELSLEIKKKKLGRNVVLCGEVENALASNNDASLYVMPSNYEGFPNALVEAMANGIPSISTNFPSGAARQLIGKNERGWLIPVGDKEKLARTMHYVLSNPNNADQKASNAVKFTSAFRRSEVAQKWIELIED